MEQLDGEMQQRVWQRVQSREPVQMPQLPGDHLKGLLLMARENLMAYTRLQKQTGPANREMLNQLRQETQRSIACMQGICRLRGEQIKAPRLEPEREDIRRTLEKCYHRERKLSTAWEQRVVDPEFGMVFDKLSRQAKERCAMIMEILGESDTGK